MPRKAFIMKALPKCRFSELELLISLLNKGRSNLGHSHSTGNEIAIWRHHSGLDGITRSNGGKIIASGSEEGEALLMRPNYLSWKQAKRS